MSLVVLRVLRLNMRENIMIEEFQNHGDTIGEDKILTDIFELNGAERERFEEVEKEDQYLVNMIDFEMFEKKKENG